MNVIICYDLYDFLDILNEVLTRVVPCSHIVLLSLCRKFNIDYLINMIKVNNSQFQQHFTIDLL